MSSNLLTVVGEKKPKQERTAPIVPIARRHQRIRVTCTTGVQVTVDQSAHTYEQTATLRALADIISPASFVKGEYWMLHPDPPIEGEDLRITAPRGDGRRRILELYKVTVEPADEPTPAAAD